MTTLQLLALLAATAVGLVAVLCLLFTEDQRQARAIRRTKRDTRRELRRQGWV